jgi:glycosyltransferase involved in cell wall biosynthesis
MRTITFSTLYPNQSQPRHGIFVEQRLRHLLATGHVESRVVAPIPWFPSANPRFGQYAVFARAPREEERYGIRILHPRYAVLPKVGLSLAPLAMALAAKSAFDRLRAEGFEPDVIDAHYLYPDGVAAALLARWYGKPVICSLLGDDVITYPRFLVPRKLFVWAARRMASITSVCQALKDRAEEWGAPAGKIRVVLHGVDLEMFRPMDREAIRARLGLSGRVLISVGHVTKRKGHHLVIEALPHLPLTTLLIAGDGWLEPRLRRMAAELGVADRVRFLGHVEQEELPELYNAADALVLASNREGMANVLLEAMACGTPVIATPVWGTPEAVSVPEAGVLMRDRSSGAVVEAAQRLFAACPDRAATRRYGETFRWERTSEQHLEELRRAMESMDRGTARLQERSV